MTPSQTNHPPSPNPSPSPIFDVDEGNFPDAVLASEVPVLVDFATAWCPPCRAIAPHLESLAAAYRGRVRIAKCDLDANPALAARYDIRSVPTLILFKAGQAAGQIVGAVPRARIESLLSR
jgi:thioredoxin